MFGENLKKIRKKNNLGQVELAKKLNVANGTISMWENNLRTPDLKTIKEIANFFSIPIYDLIVEDENEININSQENLQRTKLKVMRKEMNFTQKEVAQNLRITTQAYANYEQGLREPNIETLIKLAKLFKCSIDELIGMEEKVVEQKELNKGEAELLSITKQLSESEINRLIGYAKSMKDNKLSIEEKLNKILEDKE